MELERPPKESDAPFAARKKQYFRRKSVCRFCVEEIDNIDYKDVRLLSAFINEGGKIVPRRISGLCAPHQRRLTEAIEKARKVALLPFGKEAIDDRCIQSRPEANDPGIADLLEQRSKLLDAKFSRHLSALEKRTLDTLNAQLEKIEVQEADDLDRAYNEGRARRIETALERLGIMIEQLAYRPTRSSKQ